jgi:hypothetical protein
LGRGSEGLRLSRSRYLRRESGGPTTRLLCSQQSACTRSESSDPSHPAPPNHRPQTRNPGSQIASNAQHCLQPGCRESRPHGTFQKGQGGQAPLSIQTDSMQTCSHADAAAPPAIHNPHSAEEFQGLVGTRDDSNILTIYLLASEMRGINLFAPIDIHPDPRDTE